MTRDELNAIATKHLAERKAALEEAVRSALPLSEELTKRLADLTERNKRIVELDNLLYAEEMVTNALANAKSTTKIPYDA